MENIQTPPAQKKTRKQRIKGILLNLLIMSITFLVAFGIGEIVVRAMYKQKISLFPKNTTDAQYGEYRLRRLRPNLSYWLTSIDGQWEVRTNAQGFRNDRDFSYEKTPGKLRILSLGDSHTMGAEVRQEHTFSTVAERYLNSHGIPAEVYNTGVNGFSTAEQLIYLEQEGLRYQPEYVVLGFYRNDIEDNAKSDIYELEGSALVLQKKEHIPGVKIQQFIYKVPFTKWLSENSYFYSLLFNNTWVFFKQQMSKKNKEELKVEYAISTRDTYSEYEHQLTLKLIQRIYAVCQQHQIKLIILDLPDKRFPKKKEIVNFTPSVPDAILEEVKQSCDFFVHSTEFFADYQGGVGELHRPNGNFHITELPHTMLGVELSKFIVKDLKGEESEEVLGQIEN